jgi:hypothetical protein
MRVLNAPTLPTGPTQLLYVATDIGCAFVWSVWCMGVSKSVPYRKSPP